MTYLLVSNDPVRLEADAIKFSQAYDPSDVFWIKRHEDKKEITVDVVADLVAQANLSAVSGKKLFLIFEAETMNTAAQNKILKTIENTDDNTTFLFLCQNLNKILPTIRSRAITRHQYHRDNLTLQKLAASNPDSAAITPAAQTLLRATNLDQALSVLPVLTKPENLPLSIDALTRAVRAAELPDEKKLALYQALALITRNVEANCNPVNAFDRFLLALF